MTTAPHLHVHYFSHETWILAFFSVVFNTFVAALTCPKTRVLLRRTCFHHPSLSTRLSRSIFSTRFQRLSAHPFANRFTPYNIVPRSACISRKRKTVYSPPARPRVDIFGTRLVVFFPLSACPSTAGGPNLGRGRRGNLFRAYWHCRGNSPSCT